MKKEREQGIMQEFFLDDGGTDGGEIRRTESQRVERTKTYDMALFGDFYILCNYSA